MITGAVWRLMPPRTMALTSQILDAQPIGLHSICSACDWHSIGICCQLLKKIVNSWAANLKILQDYC